jgi:hypothetical protein
MEAYHWGYMLRVEVRVITSVNLLQKRGKTVPARNSSLDCAAWKVQSHRVDSTKSVQLALNPFYDLEPKCLKIVTVKPLQSKWMLDPWATIGPTYGLPYKLEINSNFAIQFVMEPACVSEIHSNILCFAQVVWIPWEWRYDYNTLQTRLVYMIPIIIIPSLSEGSVFTARVRTVKAKWIYLKASMKLILTLHRSHGCGGGIMFTLRQKNAIT